MGVKHYTFDVYCTFRMQFTFTESEVEPDADSGDGAVEPTDEAIKALELELQDYLGQNYLVEEIEASSDSDAIRHDPRDAPVG